MKTSFTPIRLEDYVEMHLNSNPGVERADLIRRLERAMDASKRGVRCQCGAPIWIIGSAEVGLSCFSCITGESQPDKDYEISGSENTNNGPPNGNQPIRAETNRTSPAAGSRY